jgi:hypothetical protein
MRRKKSGEEQRKSAMAADGDESTPTVVLRNEAQDAGAASKGGAWDDADEIPGSGARPAESGTLSASSTLSSGSLSFETEALGAAGDADDEIPVVIAAGDDEVETMTSSVETSMGLGATLATETAGGSSSLLGGIEKLEAGMEYGQGDPSPRMCTGTVTEGVEQVGMLDQNPGFTDTASATESVTAVAPTGVSLDDITEDLGGASLETTKIGAAKSSPLLAFDEAPRPRNRLLVYGGVTALAAAIVAAVVLWPQWGPLVMGDKSGAIAYGTARDSAKPVATVVSGNAAPAAVTVAPAGGPVPAVPHVVPAAVVPVAAPASAALAVEASYRGSWDSVIALSLGTGASMSASDKASTK